VRAGLGISTLLEPRAAAREAACLALSRLEGGSADLVLAVASAAHGSSVHRIVSEAADVLGPERMVGASVEGIVSAGVEVSGWPATLVLAIAGAEAVPFLLRGVAGGEARVGEDIASLAGAPLGERDLVVLLPDSLSLDLRPLLAGVSEWLLPATVLGAGAAPLPRGGALAWHGREIASDGLSGFVLREACPRVAISQAARLVTAPLSVTRSRGSWVTGLDGRPALDVYTEVAARCGLGAFGEGAPPLLVGIVPKERGTSGSGTTISSGHAPGDVLVRNVVGFDPIRRAFSIPETVVPGQRLALMKLDGEVARASFADQLGQLAAGKPAFTLYFNCRARGASLFGEAGVEARLLANAFADCPVAGLSGPLQIAPSGGSPTPTSPLVLTYAGALAAIGCA
jgi:small ligand-binding sensory domain FIST